MGWKTDLAAAKTAYDKGLYSEAVRHYRAAFEDSSPGEVPAPETRVDLARALRRLGQYDSALQELLHCAPQCVEKYGRQSVEYTNALEELGLVQIEQSRFAAAEQALLQALDIRKALLEEGHPDIGETLNDLGLLYWSEGEDAQAEKYYQQALRIRRDTLGTSHYAYAETLDNLGVAYQRMDRLPEAETSHKEALAIRQMSLGEEHPDVGYSLVNLAEVYRRKSEIEEIEQLLRRAIAVWDKSLGAEHPHAAVAINNLGGLYLEQEKFEEAAQLFEKAMAIMEKSFGRNNPALLTSLHNLSMLYRRQRRREDARVVDERIQQLMQKKLDENGATSTQRLLLLARSLQADRNYSGAGEALIEALQMTEADFGADSARAAKILDFLGSNSLKQSDLGKAKEYFNRALSIKRNAKTESQDVDLDLIATEQNLLFLNALQADPEFAKLIFPHAEEAMQDKSEPALLRKTRSNALAIRPLDVSKYRRIVVLTGAGISVASGLRPYRGPDGAWEDGDTERVSHISIVKDDPPAVWNYFGPLREQILAAQPNAAHRALAACEKNRHPDSKFVIITQNIDGLHQRAGSKNVVELHGSVARTKCSNDKCRVEPYEDNEFHIGQCPPCKLCGSLLRPDIVFFGEAIPLVAEHCVKVGLRDCDLFLAVGTSGVVAPACQFVRSAKYCGARTILVNLEELETPERAYDEQIIGKAEDVLPILLQKYL